MFHWALDYPELIDCHQLNLEGYCIHHDQWDCYLINTLDRSRRMLWFENFEDDAALLQFLPLLLIGGF